ncbi:MAG: hypothetical protein GQ535_13820 [Rhodobacteraceae bacterium]|nr:hypothetical protein [Paracoccaceae bacterium]
MRNILIAGWLMAASAASAQSFTAELSPPWDGANVPSGQQCRLFDGNGATPMIILQGLPEGTVQMRVEFNDKSYAPLADNGGHGVIGFQVSGPNAVLRSVPGMTDDLPAGAEVLAAARSGGQYASPGYLPPCSGGRGNRYMADVIALDATGAELARVPVELGRY